LKLCQGKTQHFDSYNIFSADNVQVTEWSFRDDDVFLTIGPALEWGWIITRACEFGKNLALLRKLFAPPGDPSWLRAWQIVYQRQHWTIVKARMVTGNN